MKRILLMLSLSIFAIGSLLAQRTITGTVTDDTGEPLIGANVVAKGTTVGTITDFDGTYSLNVPNEVAVLVFSYTGYESKDVEVGSANVLDVVLSVDRLLLDEVVVVAYGSQKKREITGAVSSVSAEDVEKIQTSHVVQGLQGKVAGVQIINQSGQPGDAPTVRFRGIGSVNASNAPLYVVDGVPFNGNINSIAPQDIESITFLKDASSNALYGSRGANGVIVVTTKKGKTPGLEITVDAKIGFNDRATPEYDIITDPGEFYEAYYDRNRIGYIINDGLDPAAAAQQAAEGLIDGPFGLGYNIYNTADDQLIDPATGKLSSGASLRLQDDWQEELFETSIRSETYLNLKSQSDQIGTFFSLGYLDDEGYAVNSGFQRITARGTFDYDVSDAVDFGASINYANTIQDAPIQNVASNTYSNLFSWARNVAPIYPVYAYDESGNRMLNEDGSAMYDFGQLDDGVPGFRPYGAFNNPVATSLFDIDQNILDNLSGRAYMSVNFLKDFKFTYNFSADFVNGNITAFATPIGGDASNVNGRLTTTSNRRLTIANQQLLNWSKSFGDHTFSVLLGHESNDYNLRLLRGQKTENLVSNIAVLNNAASIQYLEGYEKDYRVEGYLSRLNYDWRDKLFVNASFRRDGSSVFAEDNRWGNFYGFGISYDLTREKFLSNSDVVSSLRPRVSYGQQGNDALLYEQNRTITGDGDNRNYYAYKTQYDVVNAGGGVAGVQFVQLGNPDLVWETSKNLNAGFDLGLFGERVSVTVDYFQRAVEDLLFFRPLPVSEGRGAFPENVGDMENKGIEGTVLAEIIRTPDLSWSVNFNVTHFVNEITRLPQEFIDDPNNTNFRLEEGRSRYDYFMREFAGVDAENGDALWYIDELDGEGNPTGNRITTATYTDADEYFVGKSAIPDIYGGFGTNVSYKGLSLSVGFSYQSGGYGYDGVYASLLPAAGDIGHNYHKDIFKTWTPENTTAELPRIDVFDDDQNNISSLWLTDLSYLSLNDVTLSYNADFDFLQKAGIKATRIYLSGNNLNLWSKRDGYDPRLSTIGNALNEYSIVRNISFGINVTF